MTVNQIFEDFEKGFARRKFSAGLLIAFIDFISELSLEGKKLKNLEDMFNVFPRQEETSVGHRANTLIVARSNKETLSIRPFYNKAERFFRAESKRFDYPSCAPHATQAWTDYRHWLDSLVTYSNADLANLRARVVNHVLANLESQAFDPTTVQVDPPLFRLILESFKITSQQGEPTGAAYQGIVFGFLRADNPHLQVEIDKVRTGSKRLQRVGDIDCWEGARLAISAEVKQYTLKPDTVPDLEGFANETAKRGALGMVIALAFEAPAEAEIEALGLKPLGRDDLLQIVELWDPLKQRIAANSFVYYVQHIEKNASLTKRLKIFLEDASQPAL